MHRLIGLFKFSCLSLFAIHLNAHLNVITAQPANTAPSTIFVLSGETGDYISQGRSRSLTAATSRFLVNGTDKSVSISISSGSSWWRVNIAAPAGESLRPGNYFDAERAPFRTGRAPGIDISGEGRGCNKIWGSFTIDQIASDPSTGKVTLLDATFTQRCEKSSAPALNGFIKFNAPPLSYSFESGIGDWVGGGVAKQYFNGSSTFNLTGSDLGLSFNVSGKRDNWNIRIAPPTGMRLTPGSTYSTSRFATATNAGLDVGGNGRGCNSSSGTLTVNSFTLNAQGKMIGLNADFVQHCEGRAAALGGNIRFLE